MDELTGESRGRPILYPDALQVNNPPEQHPQDRPPLTERRLVQFLQADHLRLIGVNLPLLFAR